MALKLKYKDEHGIVRINMSPTPSPRIDHNPDSSDLTDPKFDTINNRFGQYDLFGGKYEGGEPRSLFRSRYNSIEEELANTPYAFATERSLRLNAAKNLDITIKSNEISPSRDIEDDRFFRNVDYDLFGPQVDLKEDEAFTVTQLIHAQDRYFDLSSRQSNESPCDVSARVPTCKDGDEAFKVLSPEVNTVSPVKAVSTTVPALPTAKRKREKSFAILAETPVASRPTSPRSLPVDIRQERVSPFRGRGFREETSRHNTPKTSATNSRKNSPPRRRTKSLPRIDKMAQTATLPPPIQLTRPHSPRNFLKENMEEVRGLSELNREKHEADAERKRIEEEEALLIEMGLLDKKIIRSRSNSRSNSPKGVNLRSRSNSPAAILLFENIPLHSKEFVNSDDGISQPVTHRSRLRSVSRSQPQSNDGSPKYSKIPKRQSSVSPTRTPRKDTFNSRRPVETNLNRNQKIISNSTSSIHETIRIGSQVHDKRGMSKSTQLLNLSPTHIKSKPPISPGRGGPPPSNKTINAKRLSPIVGTPNKSLTDDIKPSSAKTPPKPSPVLRKSIKTADNTPATSRLNSRQPSRAASRDPSPEKWTTKAPGLSKTNQTKTMSRVSNTRPTQKPSVPNSTEQKKPINRTNSMKSLIRTPSTKTLNEKPPLVKKNSKKDLPVKAQSMSKINEVGAKKDLAKDIKKPQKNAGKGKESDKKNKDETKTMDSNKADEIKKQDNETQYDKITNENGELVIMTKKNVVSMTTAAITSQPLEVVTTVTNQLPAAFEKAREKGIFEKLSSKDSLAGNNEIKEKEHIKKETKVPVKSDLVHEENERLEEKKHTKHVKNNHDKMLFTEDHVKLKPLQPPYNNPQVERVRQKIDDILKEPEISRENILTPSAKSREATNTFKNIAEKTKSEVKETKDEVTSKLTDIKDQVVKQNDKIVSEIRSEATKIVDSIITPVEEPKDIPERIKEVKKDVEPIVMVVNEKKNDIQKEIIEKINETLVKGEAEVEVQSSNVSAPGVDKMAVENKTADGNSSDKSAQRNGGFPQSTSTTPKPPARTRKDAKEKSPTNESDRETKTPTETAVVSEQTSTKQPNICERLMGKCKSKCCPCCIKGEIETKEEECGIEEKRSRVKDDESAMKEGESEMKANKSGIMDRLNCCKRKKEIEDNVRDVERAAGKASIEFENETKRKRKLRDVMCGCCGRRRRVSDASEAVRNVDAMSPGDVPLSPAVVGDTGCCGRRKSQERRDSILSDRPSASCCNNRLSTWLRGMCRRRPEHSSSRRTSMFSKNKSLSPTLPPEDTRKKLDTTLVEHTSVMRGAIPVLPIVLAYFCLFCNVIVPGLGTIFSGMFCLCFGIPRFGVHDGAKHRIGSFVINLLVGVGQLFTVLFCLVGWGWSIWWGVIMLKVSRKYRKLRAESAAVEAEAPPVTTNNHTRA